MDNTSLKIEAYNAIKKRILNMEFAPNSILSEASLLKILDMSRTPIREALMKLEQENYIQILPKKGILVVPLTLSDVDMIFETRRLIEPFALSQSYNYISMDVLKELLDAFRRCEPTDTDTFFRLDDRFHRLICTSGPNKFLNATLIRTYEQHDRIRVLTSPRIRHEIQKTLTEHIALCESILAGDIKKAVTLLKKHLKTSHTLAIHALTTSNLSI